MVGHLKFLLSLASQMFSIMEHFMFRHICCNPTSMGIPCALDGVYLVFPGLYYVRFTSFVFFAGGSAPSSMGVLGHAFLACPLRVISVLWRASLAFYRRLLALFTNSILLGTILFSGRYKMNSQTAWSWSSCMGEGGLLTLFITFPPEEIIGMLKTLAELGLVDYSSGEKAPLISAYEKLPR